VKDESFFCRQEELLDFTLTKPHLKIKIKRRKRKAGFPVLLRLFKKT